MNRTQVYRSIKQAPRRLGQGCWPLFICIALALGLTASASAQSLGWEGETGVFVTPLAYTAASPANGIGLPVVAYHYLNGGTVLGDFHEMSVTAGVFKRLEFGYTRALHTVGGDAAFSPLWHNGFNIVHGKANLVSENLGKQKWLPAISLGFMLRTQIHNVGGAIQNKDTKNGDIYVVATKTVTQSRVPIVLSGGYRATNAELWGMGGNAPAMVGRAFGAVAFVFKGPAHSSVILGSEVSQQPRHPDQLPDAVIPTTFTYCMRVVPIPERKFNIDFGVAQIAGKIAPGVDLQSRARIGMQVSYAF
jgi:hypothetical protein